MSKRPEPRRTGSVRTGGRSARVVDAVFTATREELGRVGYTALRIEDVATNSGVNKTTIYRRWPTKLELISEAIRELSKNPPSIDTGDLRADLIAMLDEDVEHFLTPERVGMLRIFYAERQNPEVDTLARKLRAEIRRPRIARIQKAIDAGQLNVGSSAELITDVLIGTVFGKIARLGDAVDHAYIVALVGLVLDGASARRS